jgi:hypothetical protein
MQNEAGSAGVLKCSSDQVEKGKGERTKAGTETNEERKAKGKSQEPKAKTAVSGRRRRAAVRTGR